MFDITGILICLGLLVTMQLLVVTATERARGLTHWRSVLSLAAMVWWIVPFLKRAYVDDFFYPDDSIIHESTARDIAHLLQNQDWQSAMDYFGFGNEGYRFFLGIFYAITNTDELVTYAIHGFLAFWGMLSVLELACVHTSARRVPLWVVLLTVANPSCIFWTTFNLKEGAMLWGICMLLRSAVRFGESKRNESLFLPTLGLLVAGFLRPHIIAAYLAALAVGVAVRQRRMGLAVATVLGMVAALAMLKTMAPAMFESISADGVGTALTERFHELNGTGGSAITYARGTPIPLVSGFLLINLRPFPWEVGDITTMAAGGEIWIITAASVFSWYSLRSRTRLLTTSYVMTLLVTIVAISFYFTYMYNMGLMVRQRVMAFPALISLAVLPALAASNERFRLPAGLVPVVPRLRRRSAPFNKVATCPRPHSRVVRPGRPFNSPALRQSRR